MQQSDITVEHLLTFFTQVLDSWQNFLASHRLCFIIVQETQIMLLKLVKEQVGFLILLNLLEKLVLE